MPAVIPIAAAVVGAVASHALNSGGGGSSPSVSNQPSMSPEQQAALKQLLETLTGRSSATDPFTGQLTAGMTPGQMTSLTALEQQALNPPNLSGPEGTLDALMRDQGTDIADSFTKSVEDPMIKDFQNKILPAITQRFGGNAAFGSDKQTAERQATGDLTDSLTAARAKMSFDAQEAAKNRQGGAATALGNLQLGAGKDQMSALLQLFGAEAIPQQTAQAGLSNQYQEFIRQQSGKQTNINDILAALGLNTVNTVVQPGQPSFLTAAAPGIGNAFTQWMMRNYFQPGGGSTTVGDPGGNTAIGDPGAS